MSRLTITRESLNALFARSGNQCAFPGCTHELVTDANLFVGQICHISAANPGGPRYDPRHTDEDRRAASNLLLLCYRHHKETDNVRLFNADSLRRMKTEHELKYSESPFKVNESFLHSLQLEIETYWSSLDQAHRRDHIVPELAVPIAVGIRPEALISKLRHSLSRVHEVFDLLSSADASVDDEARELLLSLGYDLARYDALPYYKNPLVHRNWELHALAARNVLTDVYVLLQQLEVRFYEEYVKTRTNDPAARIALADARLALKQMSVSAGYAD